MRSPPSTPAPYRQCRLDYCRYCAILTLGGVYSDIDFRCVGDLRSLLDTTERGTLVRGRQGQVINGFFAFKAPGHPFLRLALDVATAQIERRMEATIWSVTGPWIFSALSALHELGSADAFRRKLTSMGVKTPPDILLEVAGEHGSLAEAFDGVRILSFDAALRWIGGPPRSLKLSETIAHWSSWQEQGRPIFRTPGC